MRRLLPLLCLLGSVLAAGPAGAQSDAGRAVAREAFARGVAAAGEERWEDARTSFEAAWRIMRLPAILYNLAGAQAKTGHLVESAESYRRFIREAQEDRDVALRTDAEQYLADVVDRTPLVMFTIDGLAPSDRVTLDDERVEQAVVGRAMPVNPGRHELAVRRGEERLALEGFSISEGERRRMELTVPELVEGSDPFGIGGGGGSTAPGIRGNREEDSLLSSPIFWAIVGAVVVAGAVTVFVLTRPEDEQPFESSLPGIGYP